MVQIASTPEFFKVAIPAGARPSQSTQPKLEKTAGVVP
jgi:hypothetical protein